MCATRLKHVQDDFFDNGRACFLFDVPDVDIIHLNMRATYEWLRTHKKKSACVTIK